MSETQMANYTLTIVADSGYESTTEGRCTAEQYGQAMAALHGTFPQPAAQWVGLTDEDKREIVTNNSSPLGGMLDAAAKLREKNGGNAMTPEQQYYFYHLPDDLYDSKDWRSGSYADRVEWLHTMYEEKKRELSMYLEQQPADEPVAWKHDCAALLQNDVELWIDRCPHCGRPSGQRAPEALL